MLASVADLPPNLTDWWDLSLYADRNQEDVIYWRLDSFGCAGMTSEQTRDRRQGSWGGERVLIHAYVPVTQMSVLDLAALGLRLRQDALQQGHTPPALRWDRLESEDWSSSWKAQWKTQAIGDTLLIVPAWLEPPAQTQRHIIRMDPGMAFGTGSHPTTQLCLEALEMRLSAWGDEPLAPLVLADIGCGSGILSIGAGLLGAEKIYAVDMDPLAVEATQHNCELNHLGDRVQAHLGSLEHIPEMVDGLVCNILADVILDMIPEFRLVVKEDGWLILSGILLEQAKFVSEMLENHDWMVSALWKRGEWCCLNVRQE